MRYKLKSLILAVVALVSCSGHETVDVLIVGGGASGISAGVQSARMGTNTMIVEETPWVGGMLTSAGVSCVDGNYNLRGGIFGEFADSLAARYGGWEALKTGWVSHINFEPHVGQEVLTNIAEACGNDLRISRETAVLSVEGEEGNWRVTLKDRDGRKKVIRSRILVDATELGDIAKACGVPYRIGMEAAEETGESIAPESANDIIQDLTFVAVLKDYGKDADKTIAKPEGYDPLAYANCAVNRLNTVSETGQTIWPAEQMITYGALPGGKYMINWPICGNDYYVNSIEMTPEKREEAYEKAKNFTLGFLYFIQTELGMKNLGLADDEFPTEDGLPFFPYHRESRRIEGEAFFTVDAASRPYDFELYRTGVAVGDYAVDHHHFRYPDWRSLPDLHFYPIPSYNVPLGVLIPKSIDGLLVAEKSVSVSNLVNGTTRLQPVVMQLGQAAGALASLACLQNIRLKDVNVRSVQSALLESGCYIMPYLDLTRDHRHFKALQRIGATGILRGEGRNVGWANQTWFRADEPLKYEDIFIKGYYDCIKPETKGNVTCSRLIGFVESCGGMVPEDIENWWTSLGLTGWDPSATATRLEAAVVIDAVLNPFDVVGVDYSGALRGGHNRLVDPLIGSGGHGHVFVGANVPHGMIAVGPNNISEGWDWCSGYHDSERTIAGFAQTHLSGTGVTDLGEIVLMPYLGAPKFVKGTGNGDGFAVTYDKSRERVSPGYYSISLFDDRLSVDLTAGDRVAYHRYASNEPFGLILDLKSSAKSLMARQGYHDSGIRKVDRNTITGFRLSDEWARDHKVYFALRSSAPVTEIVGENPIYALSFGETDTLEVRVAVSYNSEEAALANLDSEERVSFAEAEAKAAAAWESSLSSIEFKGINGSVDTIFYTSLYHTAFAPQLFSDAGEKDSYTIFSTWDTYRAVHPLYTIIDPLAGEYVNSLLDIHETSGRLPVWHLAGFETDCMVGVHSVPIIVDAALKGVAGVDRKRALKAVRQFPSQPVEGLEYIDSLGYLPADKVNWSVSRALEYCIDDDAVARLAEACSDRTAAEYHASRAQGYRKYFDPETGFMRARLTDGTFREPFDPAFSLHEIADYVEGNGWQYTWLVPHDPHGLISLFGGDEQFTRKLDAMFMADETLNEGASADITGMIGQYAHGNEPSHHTLYLYAYAGQQYKTAEKVRQVCREFYTLSPDGLIGNEDCGQMSAWYIFTSLGFYPVHPTAGIYVFGSPLCHEAVIHTVSGKDFRVIARNNSDRNIYIQSVTFNGEPYDRSWISHDMIMNGGELVFDMGDKPSSFGSEMHSRPFSEDITTK